MDNAAPKSFTFQLPTYLFTALKKKADEDHRTPSNMLRVILEKNLEAPRGDVEPKAGVPAVG